MPILGLIASSTRQGLATNSYESISTPTISGSANFVDFTSIPQTYKYLQIRFSVIGSVQNSDITVQFNSDTASNYTYHELRGNGSTTTASGNGSTTFGYVATNATSSTYPCVGIVDIFDYADTNKKTTVRTLSGKDENGGGTVQILTGVYKQTTAITSIRFDAGTTIATNSKIALYGIKG
jgi:hypothetical protein